MISYTAFLALFMVPFVLVFGAYLGVEKNMQGERLYLPIKNILLVTVISMLLSLTVFTYLLYLGGL